MRDIESQMIPRAMRSVSTVVMAVVLLCSMAAPPAAALAHTPAPAAPSPTSLLSSNGLRISPVRSDLTIPAGTSQTVQLNVVNLTSNGGYIQPNVDDFTAGNNENGVPSILLGGQSAPSHGLKSYVLPMKPFLLSANGTASVNVTIKIPPGTAPGGYYGAVRFLPYNPATGKNVNLTGSVASLFLVTVPGKVFEQLSIASFDVRKLINAPYDYSNPGWMFPNSKSLHAVVRFSNTGNLQEEPFGKIILKKGKTVLQTSTINNSFPPGSVLPSSIRLFSVKLSNLGSLGKYTIYGNFGYGTTGQLLSSTYTFYIIPTALFVIGGIVLVLLVLLIFILPRMLRAYNRRVLRRSRRW